jgi:MFS family permease
VDIPYLIQRYISLVFGVLLLGMAGHAAVTGKLRGRFGEVAYRDRDGKKFWGSLAIYCLSGTGFLLFFLYKVHAFSN